MKTLKFKLYQHKRNRKLKRTINAAGLIYNHCIALHRRYYRMFGKYLNMNRLKSHIAKLRNKNEIWLTVGSQAVQQICEKIDIAYQNFFKRNKKGVRPPKFKKVRRYKSFTLKQAGYKFLGGNRVKIGKQVYQFWNSREIEGKIKTVTIKRTPIGELFLCVVVESVADKTNRIMTGRAAGFDFGLKTFLTSSEGEKIESPQFFKQSISEIRKASRSLSRKKKGSANRERARLNLARVHEKVKNRRDDWFWKLAHELTDKYDELYFEDLNLEGMKRLWGRKISDLALDTFLQILGHVAKKKDVHVGFIDRWYPSSKTCSSCGHVHSEIALRDREWTCPSCGTHHDRDENASINIKAVGMFNRMSEI